MDSFELKPSPTGYEDFFKVLLITSIVFLLCYDVSVALTINPRNWFADEGCYMQALGTYLGIDGEHVCGNSAFRAAGVTLLWLPFAAIGKYIAHFKHENVTEYILGMISYGSVLFWAVTFFFVKRILKESSRKTTDYLFIVAVLFNIPSFYYVFSRPFMPHAAEAMLAFGFVYFLKKSLPVHALLMAVWLTLTRYNDAPVFLMLVAWMLDQRRRSGTPFHPRTVKLIGVVVGLAVIGIGWVSLFYGYDSYTVIDLLHDTKWKGAYDFFISPNWGILWSGTWWLVSLLLGLWHFRRLSFYSRAAVLWMIAEAVLCIGWNGNGNSFAFRYLIGSYAAALVVWMEVYERKPKLERLFKAVTWLGGAWIFWVLLLFGIVPLTSAMWSADGQTCLNDTQAMYYTFKYAFDPDYLKHALARQILPLQLYIQKHPDLADPKWAMTALSETRYAFAWFANFVAFVYIGGFTLWTLVQRRKRH